MLISTKKVHESLEIGDIQLKVVAIQADEQGRMRVRLEIATLSCVLLDDTVKLTDITVFSKLPERGQIGD